MKFVDGWWWPDGEQHMLEWIADPKNRLILNGRPAYQGKKIQRTLELAYNHGIGRRRVAVDVGAHIGLWTWNLQRHFQAVHAFEPVEEHRACFHRNITEAAGANVTDSLGMVAMHACALGEREDMVAIRVNPTSSGDSWVKGKGTVPMRTLDSLHLADVDLIKIDCEGYEEFVIYGAVDTIIRCRPLIVVEQKRDMAVKFGLKPQGAIAYLKGMGYEQVDEMAGDYFMAWNGGGK